MDYIDKIVLSTNPKDEILSIFSQIDNELRQAYDLLDGISGIDNIENARDIICKIRHDIEE